MKVSGLTIRRTLGVDKPTWDKWIDLGLPYTGTKDRRTFDPVEVRRWLVSKGLAEEKQPELFPEDPNTPKTAGKDLVSTGQLIELDGPLEHPEEVTSLGELAAILGASSRTIHNDYRPQPWFPKAPYNVKQIVALIRKHKPLSPIPEEYEHRIAGRSYIKSNSRINNVPGVSGTKTKNEMDLVKLDKMKFEFERERGEWVLVDEVEAFCLRTCNYVIVNLKGLSNNVDSQLPESTDPELRDTIRYVIDLAVDECCRAINELIEGDSDEKDVDDLEEEQG